MILNCYPDVDNLLFDVPLKRVLSIPDSILALNASVPVEVLKLSVRPAKRLSQYEIHTLPQLLALTMEELYEMRGMGQGSIREIVHRLCDFFGKAIKLADACRVLLRGEYNAWDPSTHHEWTPFTFRNDWDIFSNGTIPPRLPVTALLLSPELREAFSSSQCEQLDELLDWTWERAQQQLGENAAEEISEALITLAQEFGEAPDADSFRCSLAFEERQEILERRWGHSLISTCGFLKRTRRLLKAAGISTLQQLFEALSPLCPVLCLDLPAFEDVWNRLVVLGLKQGSARSAWEHLVTPERCNVPLDSIIAAIRRVCTEHQWNVLNLHYGLQPNAVDAASGGICHTFVEISQLLGISSDAARQIGWAASKKLRNMELTSWNSLTATLCAFMDSAGGALSVKDAAQKVTAHIPATGVNAEAVCYLLFEISDEVIRIQHKSIYCRCSFPTADYPLVISRAVKTTRKTAIVLSIEDLSRHVCDLLMAEGHPVALSVVAACIRADGRFASASPRNDMKYHLVQILRQIGQPAHITELTAQLNALDGRSNRTTKKSVRARLSGAHHLFVCIGVGIYGLTEWGLEDKRVLDRGNKRTIGDIVEEFLTERNAPANTSEIIAFVLSHKLCHRNSILLRLFLDDRFQAIKRGRYGLKKWVC